MESIHTNPFVRGFDRLHISRAVEIELEGPPPGQQPVIDDGFHPVEDDVPEVYTSVETLDPTQENLKDEEILGRPTKYLRGYAHVRTNSTEGAGKVISIRYRVIGVRGDAEVRLAETLFAEQARTIIHLLEYTGGFVRAFEINAAHLPIETFRNLEALAGIEGGLFEIARLRNSEAKVLRLKNTPWEDFGLSFGSIFHGVDVLRAFHRLKGLPESLIEVMHLAGRAGVQSIVFDTTAPVLAGLKLYEDWP
jgi:hypothetical protein